MALQTSGAISLNDMHIEVGGTSGTTVSLNDTDIRGLISKASAATMSFNEWYGASASFTFTITQGNDTSSPYASGHGYSKYGTISSTPIGSVSPNPATFTDGNGNSQTIGELAREGSSAGNNFKLALDGNVVYTPNLFTQLDITLNGTAYTFTRSSAGVSYSSSGNHTTYTWGYNQGFFVNYSDPDTQDLLAQFPSGGTGNTSATLS